MTVSSHVFVSYRRADSRLVGSLITDLNTHGVEVWQDVNQIKLGTPSWEDAIREAIRNASAVLLMVTPRYRHSPVVLGEVTVALMYKRPIYPIWIEGQDDLYPEYIPLMVNTVQYVDARADAQKAIREIVQALRDGSGLLPAAAPGKIEETIPQGIVKSIAQPQADKSPYVGLKAFRSEDADRFFGREVFVETLLKTLQGEDRGRFLGIIGASGSGKSSVMMAGLLPALKAGGLPGSDRWIYLEPILPGRHPIEALGRAITRTLPDVGLDIEKLRHPNGRGLVEISHLIQPDQRLVIYADQFEEVFTLAADEAERQQFINLLTTAAQSGDSRTLILLTMRADYYDRPLRYPELGNLLDTCHVAILPMSLAELYEAVQKPAQLFGLTFDDGLVADLVFNVRGQAGALPMLQFTLDQLYDHREGNRLTKAAYDALGGVQGALSQHAEATYQSLPDDRHRKLARELFLRLIGPGMTPEETTRHRASESELELSDAVQDAMMRVVVKAFDDARLLTINRGEDGATIEVSHEALMQRWETWQTWLKEARNDVALQKKLTADANAWVRANPAAKDDLLYRGTELVDAQGWAARNQASQDELAFIGAGVARERELAQEEMARLKALEDAQTALAQEREASLQMLGQAEKRTRRRTRFLIYVAVSAAVIVVAAALGVNIARQDTGTAMQILDVANTVSAYSNGISWYNLGEYDFARQWLNFAAAQDINLDLNARVRLYDALASTCLQLEDYDCVEQNGQRVLALNPDYTRVFLPLARAYREQQRYPQASEMLDRMEAAYRKNAETDLLYPNGDYVLNVARASVAFYQADWEQVIDILTRFVDREIVLARDKKELFYYLAASYQEMGKIEEACRQWDIYSKTPLSSPPPFGEAARDEDAQARIASICEA